jgi:rRNA-processing protein FCF1
MDSDCLIKFTKAGLKELIVKNYVVFIPSVVEFEVVETGKVRGHIDALIVKENIERKLIHVIATKGKHDGDSALIENFALSECQYIATDDKKLTRILKSRAIPYLLPAVMIYHLCQIKIITKAEAKKNLSRLKPYISPDELNAVNILLEKL